MHLLNFIFLVLKNKNTLISILILSSFFCCLFKCILINCKLFNASRVINLHFPLFPLISRGKWGDKPLMWKNYTWKISSLIFQLKFILNLICLGFFFHDMFNFDMFLPLFALKVMQIMFLLKGLNMSDVDVNCKKI